MSRLSEYAKFDHIDSSDEEEKLTPVPVPTSESVAHTTKDVPSLALQFRRSPVVNSNRFRLEHGDRLIYEWEQTLNDVTLYIPTPPFVTQASDLVCRIQPQHLQVGNIVQGVTHLFINEDTAGKVEVASSTWTWEKQAGPDNGLLTIELSKANKGVVWEAACLGPPPKNIRLNPLQLEEEKQRLLLERWQEENPGMDFRDATFNGQAPDPRTFMGGVSH
jgi:hypothetical protein